MINRFAMPMMALLLGSPLLSAPARADNPMGYRMQTAEQAASLQRSGGSLGMRVGPVHQISSGGLTFELLKVEGVGEASPAAQAGLKVGDQLIAVDGRVFPNVATFAAYVGSVPPGHQVEVDYMPAGAGPGQAQRVGVTVGEGGRAAARQDVSRNTGLSTGAKVAIGVGAAAIIGCYETNCYSRLKTRIEEERERHRDDGDTAQPH